MTIWLRRLPRWFNRLYAKAFGYFWMPCPLCGRDFGGHEAAAELLHGRGRMLRFDKFVCWRCEAEAKWLNWNHAAWDTVVDAAVIRRLHEELR